MRVIKLKKIPTIFKRDPENMKLVLNEPHPDCDWVFSGTGVATQKLDGTCCLISNGELFRRREVRPGKVAPPGFVEVDCDKNTGKKFGWVRVDPEDPDDRYHIEAFQKLDSAPCGTYELIGPKMQGNPEREESHILVNHQSETKVFVNCSRTFEGLKEWFSNDDIDIEGLVFHNPDGRMAKIKKSDFGFKRKPATPE